MHSSRMRTARSLTASRSIRGGGCGGGGAWWGVGMHGRAGGMCGGGHGRGGVHGRGDVWHVRPPDRILDTRL